MSRIKFGIIGGAGPYASALLYKSLLDCHYQQGILEIPELTLLNFPFTRGMSVADSSQQEQKICEELQHCIETLAKVDVSIAALACNTLHLFLEKIDLKGIQFIHMPKAVLEEVSNNGVKRLLVLATPTTLAKGLYERSDLTIISPTRREQELVDAIIDRILHGKITSSDALALSELVFIINQRGKLDGVVLGCTELPVLHHTYPLEIPGIAIFDSIQILAKQFLEPVAKLALESKFDDCKVGSVFRKSTICNRV